MKGKSGNRKDSPLRAGPRNNGSNCLALFASPTPTPPATLVGDVGRGSRAERSGGEVGRRGRAPSSHDAPVSAAPGLLPPARPRLPATLVLVQSDSASVVMAKCAKKQSKDGLPRPTSPAELSARLARPRHPRLTLPNDVPATTKRSRPSFPHLTANHLGRCGLLNTHHR